MDSIHTIELNLDDDYANACSYHIDDLKSTIQRNIHEAENSVKNDRWVLVGLAHSLSEAHDKCDKLRKILCERNNKKPYGIEDILERMAQDHI